MFARALSRLFSPRGWGDVRPDDPARYLRYLPVPQLPSNLQFTMDTALQLSVVWACVDVISKAVAASYWDVRRREGKKWVEAPDDPLDWVLNVRPNPEMTGIGWRECMMYAGVTWGNAYSEIVFDRAGRVKELWPLLPERMTPRRRPTAGAELYYDYYTLDGQHVELEPYQVFHLKGPSITGLMGENVVARAAKSIALAIAAERFALSFYGNNGIVGSRLVYPGKLDPATHDRLRNEWDEKRQGAEKAHRPMILEGGMKLEQDTPDASSTAMVESRTFQVEEICRWFGVPPHKVQHLLRATFNNIEHLGLEFTRDAITPWSRRLEQEADYKLMSDRGPRRATKLDTTWLSQGDNESRAKAAVSWRSAGVKTANEIRHEEGLNPLGPEGDVLLVGSGMKTIKTVLKEEEQVGKAPPQPKLPPGAPAEEPPGEEDDSKTKQGAKKQPKPTDDRVQQVVRDAAVALFASAIDRYNRRLAARQADLERHGHAKERVLENLAHEKDRLRPWLIKECERAVAIVKQASGGSMDETEILVAADAVDNGETPHVAAERLVSTYFAATEVARG